MSVCTVNRLKEIWMGKNYLLAAWGEHIFVLLKTSRPAMGTKEPSIQRTQRDFNPFKNFFFCFI